MFSAFRAMGWRSVGRSITSSAAVGVQKATWSTGSKIGAGFSAIPLLGWVGWCGSGEEPWERLKMSYNLPVRLARNCFAAAAIINDYRSSLKGVEGVERSRVIAECHQRGADRLLALCFANGGIYIKLGQHIGQLDHLLPDPYVHTMRDHLLDKCPITPYEEVCRILRDEFGQGPKELFDDFEVDPIASASLAQVHKAWDHSGRKLAVKIQHPGLTDGAAADIATVEFLVHAIKRMFPRFDYSWLVKEIKRNLPKELDFLCEIENAERCRNNLNSPKSRVRGRVKIPEMVKDLSSRRVLTMEFIDGVGVTDKEGLKRIGVDAREVAQLLARTFNEMIFVFGDVHCDPHEANLLVCNKEGSAELVLLDHGLYEFIDESFRKEYASLWHALVFADAQGIEKHSRNMNAGDLYALFAAMMTQKSWDEVTQQSTHHLKLTGSKDEKKRIQTYAQQYATEISELLLRIPRELLLLLKTNDCLRAVDKCLGQPINTLTITARECTRALALDRSYYFPPLVSFAVYSLDLVRVEMRLFALRALSFLAYLQGLVRWG